MADVFGNQGQFLASDISNFIAQNINNPQAIAQAAQQYGVSAQDIQKAAGYTPTQQAQYFGNAGLPSLQPLTVEQLYTDVLGRSSDIGGAKYWTEKFGPTIDPNEIAEFKAAAAPELVKTAYQNVLGREADVPGAEYYTQQLQSGALTADKLKEALAYGAQGLEDRLKAQAALGKDIFAPAEFLKGTSGMGYEDIVNYITANVSDPVRVAQAAARYDVDPNEILQAYQGKSPYSLQQIQNYLAQGQAGLGTRIQDIIGSTIGDANLISAIEGALPASTSRLASLTPESLASKSVEEIEKLIAESPTNKLQEAARVRGMAQRLYGASEEDAKKLASDLFAGKDTDDFAESLYKDLLTKGFTKETQTKLLQDAAVRAPGSEYFKENPEDLLIYSPLKKKTGSSGQYGYVNNAPILNATFADQKLGDKNQVIPHLGQDSDFGWMTNSKYTETLARGPAVFGVEFNNRNDIEKAIDFERRIKDGTIIADPEGGYYDTIKNIGIEAPKSDNERKGYNPYSSDTLAKLQEAAQKVGLDPRAYKSSGDLFDALENKTKNFYQVVGRAIDWDPEAAKNLGITQTTSGRGGVNQANVLYERIGDKLVPVTAKAFEFHDPNTSSGFFGDLAKGIASIPFVAELALLNPATAAYYPVIKGVQVGALTGDIGKAIQAGGLAYLTTQFIPKNIAPQLQMSILQSPLVSELAMSGNSELANFISQAGSRAIVSGGLATLTGQDPDKAALSALISSGVMKATDTGVELANIPAEYKTIVARILADTVLGGDISKSLTSAATNLLKGELKDFGREMIKSDQDKDRSKEIRI